MNECGLQVQINRYNSSIKTYMYRDRIHLSNDTANKKEFIRPIKFCVNKFSSAPQLYNVLLAQMNKQKRRISQPNSFANKFDLFYAHLGY